LGREGARFDARAPRREVRRTPTTRNCPVAIPISRAVRAGSRDKPSGIPVHPVNTVRELADPMLRRQEETTFSRRIA
jgi:hypothetical protein